MCKLAEAIKKAKKLKKSGSLNIVDVYKLNKLSKVEKGVNAYGEIIFGYEYSPEYFVQSDVSKMMCRYFIEIDGIVMHPDEISRVSIKRDGTAKLQKQENLRFFIDDPEAYDRFRSFGKAISAAAHTATGKRPTTIFSPDSGNSISMTQVEWLRWVNKLMDRNTYKVTETFQEFYDMVSG